MNCIVRGILILALVCFSLNARVAFERILDFNSVITVLPNAQLRVHETITIALPAGRHGIYRDFPTEYHDRFNTRRSVAFVVEKAQENNADVPYQVTSHFNGKRIKIGDAHTILSGGIYIYDIEYITDWQIGFFKDHDELYWNVTGNGWPMAIEHASAQVILPAFFTANQISLEAYTGYQGQQGSYYKAQWQGPNKANWETTHALLPEQGLTIVITWPKGIVQEPTWLQKLHYFIRSNLDILWLIMGILAILAYCFFMWLKIWREQNAGTIIPLFYPPKDWSPGQVRYFMAHGYDDKVFAAEIINMAVHGYLTIESKQEFLSRSYILHKKEGGNSEFTAYYQPLLNMLFLNASSLEIKQKNYYCINGAITAVRGYLSRIVNNYFNYHEIVILGAIFIAFAALAGFFYLGDAPALPLILGCAVLIAAIVAFYFAVRGYTNKGITYKNEIEGFKLFLETTETDRLAVVGTPPTKTPELYEKYLPYAVAFGVEKQWSAQFAPIFARFEQQGHPYVPLWYVGPLHGFSPGSFATNLSDSLSSSIASSAISSSRSAPGFSSGAGGRGSSGGGGGGGGGGSW